MINKPEIVWSIVENKNKKILLCQRSYDDFLGGLWNLPGGKVESFDENLQAAAQRELIEEVGISGYDLDILFQTTIEKYKTNCFRCNNWSGIARPSTHDIIGVGWFSIDQMYQMQDSITPYLLLALPFMGYMSVQDRPCILETKDDNSKRCE